MSKSCTQAHSITASRPAAGLGGFVPGLRRLPVALFDALLVWQERADQRRHLAQLDERMLRDIGVSRADALREAAIPFWRES